jgi:signal transduction histidine kinase
VTQDAWTAWPSWQETWPRNHLFVRMRLAQYTIRAAVVVGLLFSTFSDHPTRGWQSLAAASGVAAAIAVVILFTRAIRQHHWTLTVTCVVALVVASGTAYRLGFEVAATVLGIGTAVAVMQRLPLVVSLPTATVTLGGYAVVSWRGDWLGTLATVVGLTLAGFVLRQENESRWRLREQERAARLAEAESAALNERARIARDIHDVLAHSLSAQLVHLEAARLRIEQEPESEFRNQILERVVGARTMARDGLAETRQALSALRGEMAPLGTYLKEIAGTEGAEILIEGTPRPVSAEASQTVRRVVQEALTNVRKHAPGALVRITLSYGDGELALAVRDSGGQGTAPEGLGSSGGGYGLRGMRERAELLGGTLDAGPGCGGADGVKGYTVQLRVPV